MPKLWYDSSIRVDITTVECPSLITVICDIDHYKCIHKNFLIKYTDIKYVSKYEDELYIRINANISSLDYLILAFTDINDLKNYRTSNGCYYDFKRLVRGEFLNQRGKEKLWRKTLKIMALRGSKEYFLKTLRHSVGNKYPNNVDIRKRISTLQIIIVKKTYL